MDKDKVIRYAEQISEELEKHSLECSVIITAGFVRFTENIWGEPLFKDKLERK